METWNSLYVTERRSRIVTEPLLCAPRCPRACFAVRAQCPIGPNWLTASPPVALAPSRAAAAMSARASAAAQPVLGPQRRKDGVAMRTWWKRSIGMSTEPRLKQGDEVRPQPPRSAHDACYRLHVTLRIGADGDDALAGRFTACACVPEQTSTWTPLTNPTLRVDPASVQQPRLSVGLRGPGRAGGKRWLCVTDASGIGGWVDAPAAQPPGGAHDGLLDDRLTQLASLAGLERECIARPRTARTRHPTLPSS